MLKVTDLAIDPQSLGSNFLLIGIAPNFQYKDGTKTDIIDGYKYQIALPAHKLEKINVKILGSTPLFDINDKETLNAKLLEMPEIIFSNLAVKIYYIKETGYGVSATADSVRLASSEKIKTEVKINA